MPKSKKPRFKPNTGSPTGSGDLILKHLVRGDDEGAYDRVLESLSAGTLDFGRVKRIVNAVDPIQKRVFFTVLDGACAVTNTQGFADQEKVTLQADVFAITVSGPADDIHGMINHHLTAFTQLLRVSGFSKSDANVFISNYPYTLEDLVSIPPQNFRDACVEVIRMSTQTADIEMNPLQDIMPQPTPMSYVGITTRTFIGFRFTVADENDTDMFSDTLPEEEDYIAMCDAYQSAAHAIFGDDCEIGIPQTWDMAMETAVLAELKAGIDLLSDEFVVDGVDVEPLGDKTGFRFFSEDMPNVIFEVRVPTLAVLRCPEDSAEWVMETLDLAELSFEHLMARSEAVLAETDAFLKDFDSGFENEDLPDDMTNLVPFSPRKS